MILIIFFFLLAPYAANQTHEMQDNWGDELSGINPNLESHGNPIEQHLLPGVWPVWQIEHPLRSHSWGAACPSQVRTLPL